jgi:hypothetical protein
MRSRKLMVYLRLEFWLESVLWALSARNRFQNVIETTWKTLLARQPFSYCTQFSFQTVLQAGLDDFETVIVHPMRFSSCSHSLKSESRIGL